MTQPAFSWYEDTYGAIINNALRYVLSQAAVLRYLILISSEILVNI